MKAIFLTIMIALASYGCTKELQIWTGSGATFVDEEIKIYALIRTDDTTYKTLRVIKVDLCKCPEEAAIEVAQYMNPCATDKPKYSFKLYEIDFELGTKEIDIPKIGIITQ